MGLIDVIILVVTLGILGSILFFTFYNRKNKDKCHCCPYKSKCTSKTCGPDEKKEDKVEENKQPKGKE